MKLTDISIRKLKLRESGQKIYRDDSVPGFGVRVSNKYKTFVVMYGEKRQLKTIGRYPDISLADARQEAKAVLLHAPEPTSSIKYPEAMKLFLADCEHHNRPETIRGYKGYLGKLEYRGKLADLNRAKMKKHLSRYDDKPSGYSHALAVYRIFFNFCLRQEFVDKSPISGEKAIAQAARERVLLPEEIKEIWAYNYRHFSTIIKLLLLTGQRRSEVASIEPEWICDGMLTLPAVVTKNKRKHAIPLSSLSLELLSDVPFGQNGKAWNGWSNGKRRIDKNVEIDHWTIHDLRRTFATIHAEIGTPIHITEKHLNHASGTTGGIVGIYNRYSYMDEMRKAQENYEACLLNIVAT